MQQTGILVWTGRYPLTSGAHGYKSSLQARLDHITTMSEKGPCSTFRYDSTQDAKMPRMAPNLQFWTCGPQNDGMIAKKELFPLNLYRTSLTTCLVGE